LQHHTQQQQACQGTTLQGQHLAAVGCRFCDLVRDLRAAAAAAAASQY
jgi:hypothetical protein